MFQCGVAIISQRQRNVAEHIVRRVVAERCNRIIRCACYGVDAQCGLNLLSTAVTRFAMMKTIMGAAVRSVTAPRATRNVAGIVDASGSSAIWGAGISATSAQGGYSGDQFLKRSKHLEFVSKRLI